MVWGWGECFGAGECFEAPTPALIPTATSAFSREEGRTFIPLPQKSSVRSCDSQPLGGGGGWGGGGWERIIFVWSSVCVPLHRGFADVGSYKHPLHMDYPASSVEPLFGFREAPFHSFWDYVQTSPQVGSLFSQTGPWTAARTPPQLKLVLSLFLSHRNSTSWSLK